MRARPPLMSRNFVLLCAATLIFFTSTMMQIPIFPDFLRERTGAGDAMIGVVIGIISVTAVLLRPLVGRELQRHQRRTYIALAGVVTTSATLAYLAGTHLGLLIPVRLYHGISVASFYVAASTLVVDLAPEERRAEALSYFSMFLYLGIALGPALGLTLRERGGFGLAFGASAALGALCVAVSRTIREAPPPRAGVEPRGPLLNRKALFPTGVLSLAAVAYAAALTFTADAAEAAGIEGGELYFPVLAGTVIGTRFFAGRLSDRYGRVVVAAPGLALFAVSVMVEAGARSLTPLLASAVIFGIGFGMFFPSMLAFTVDRVPADERGSAMGTLTAAFDLGFGAGTFAMGALIGAAGYPAMYRVAGALAFGALIVLVAGTAGRGVPAPAPADF